MQKTIAVLPGDGIGPEVIAEAKKILDQVALKFNHKFIYRHGQIGGAAISDCGSPLPQNTLDLCLKSDAVLFGAVGSPRYESAALRPEHGLLALRKELGLFANIRPIFTIAGLSLGSPLLPKIAQGTNFVVIRELLGGLYFGKQGRSKDGRHAFDTCTYSKDQILNIGRYAFNLSTQRKNKLTVVDKANVLETSRLWRETIEELSSDFPGVKVEFMYVDNASMQILKNPKIFDVILTENMFGDILTDEASVITGSLGMLASASIGEKVWLYEPIHGSFPDAAGKNIANPIGAILSAAMLLEYSFGLKEESRTVFKAVEKVLSSGYGTRDIAPDNPLTTNELGTKIKQTLSRLESEV